MTTRSIRTPWPHLVLLACLASSACAGRFPYSIPIQQGNVITVDMLQELRLGMDKRKVKFILGTPLVTDVFHQDRWDYFYSYNPGGGDTVQQRASLYFDGDRLVRIDADIESDIDFHTVTHTTEKVLIVPPKKDDGLFAAITPGFVTRDEEQARQDEIERELDSGFNEPQPGSGDASTAAAGTQAIDPALEPAPAGPPGVGSPARPSEIYAPNTSAGFDSVESTPPRPATETLSAETREQSRYLEALFDEFGQQRTRAVQREQAPAAEEQPSGFTPRDPTITTRD